MKTKIIAVLTAVMASFGWHAHAQTNDTNNAVAPVKPAQFKTLLETNWVKPGPYLRIVNGTLYNVAYSRLWRKFSEQEGLGVSMLDPSNDGETSHLVGSLTQIKPDFVVYTIEREWMSHETYTGMLYKTRDEFEKKVVVLNGPTDGSLDFLCMKTTNHLNSDGVPFETFDCGVQATNLVPVVKSIKIKLNP